MARLAWLVLGTALCLTVSCGTTPRPPAPPSPSATIRLPRPSAATGPCATVTATIPIDQAPPACAAVWAPYGVTKVPPANLTDSVPVPTEVVNDTGGAVSDAQAREWALAVNRVDTWLAWSERNGQFGLTPHLESPSVINVLLDQAMRRGISVIDPPCDLYPIHFALENSSPAAERFFTRLGQRVHGDLVMVETYPGPCAITGASGNGTAQTLLATSTPTTTTAAGHITVDPMLGSIWFVDGAGFCTTPGVPREWCPS